MSEAIVNSNELKVKECKTYLFDLFNIAEDVVERLKYDFSKTNESEKLQYSNIYKLIGTILDSIETKTPSDNFIKALKDIHDKDIGRKKLFMNKDLPVLFAIELEETLAKEPNLETINTQSPPIIIDFWGKTNTTNHNDRN
jgi:hypothetical protein